MVREFAPPAQAVMFPGPRSNGGGGVPTPFSSTFTPTIGLEVPARGDYPNQWDLPMDATLQTLDSMAGGVATITVAGGNQTINLTAAQANCAVLNIVGTLTGGYAIITYPTNAGAGQKWVIPGCSGMSPTTNFVYVRGAGGADTHGIYFWTQFGIPHSILVTPSRVYWDYGGSHPGALEMYATGFIPNGRIPLDGRTISQTAHDLLYDIYGLSFGGVSGSTFGVPDCRGVALVGGDVITSGGASAGRLGPNYAGTGVGTIVGAGGHALTTAELASHNHGLSDPGHVHGVSDPGHAHSLPQQVLIPAGGSNVQPGAGWGFGSINTNAAGTGIGIAAAGTGISIAAAGSGATHNIVQASRTCMPCVRW